MVNCDESSKVYAGYGRSDYKNLSFAFQKNASEFDSDRVRSNSVEDRTNSRGNILPNVDHGANAMNISNMIKKNLTDRETLKRDLNNLK